MDEEPLFAVQTATADGATTLTLQGEFDISSRGMLQSAITHALAGHPAKLIIDLRTLSFIDSTGLGLLLGAHQTASTDGVSMELFAGPPHVHRPFEITMLTDVLAFVEPPTR